MEIYFNRYFGENIVDYSDWDMRLKVIMNYTCI